MLPIAVILYHRNLFLSIMIEFVQRFNFQSIRNFINQNFYGRSSFINLLYKQITKNKSNGQSCWKTTTLIVFKKEVKIGAVTRKFLNSTFSLVLWINYLWNVYSLIPFWFLNTQLQFLKPNNCIRYKGNRWVRTQLLNKDQINIWNKRNVRWWRKTLNQSFFVNLTCSIYH